MFQPVNFLTCMVHCPTLPPPPPPTPTFNQNLPQPQLQGTSSWIRLGFGG